MVIGFFRHLYHYFSQEIDPADDNQPPNHFRGQPGRVSLENTVPLIDKDGRIKAWVEDTVTLKDKPSLIKNHPVFNMPAHKSVPELEMRPHSLPATNSLITAGETSKWDPWPNGSFHLDLNWQEVGESKKLQSHWAEKINGGDRRGHDLAEAWEKGKRTTRVCLGVFMCDNQYCDRATRPKIDAARLDAQKNGVCQCQANLVYQPCGVRSVLWTWSEGIHFQNYGTHLHARPPPIHATKEEEERFASLVKHNPKSGPLELLVGVPTLQGPGESAAEISDVYLNADRISKEKQKIKHGIDGFRSGDTFIATFAEFDLNHPAFLVSEVFGAITVISFQSPLMVSQLIHDDILESPVNGLVNDAAHGWWKESNSLLMITSAYSPDLRCWVPGLFSYTNGASAEHYVHHFVALMETMAIEAERRGIKVHDHLFAGVMDFSEAERNGFIKAFISFWSRRPDDCRDEDELREAAQRVLRGCKEHFRSGVTRLSRINGVIPPASREVFVKRALALVSEKTHTNFIENARLIIRDFPETTTWLAWWLRPAHAAMLFESQKVMDPRIWESLPDTTNAEEAMHWKLYAAAGRKHLFFEGISALYAVAVYYARIFNASNQGIAIRYGVAERWKKTKAKIGRTKPTRATDASDKKRVKNDGRPPDTIKDLLLAAPTKKQKKEVSYMKKKLDVPSFVRVPSYRWQTNSCWLDTSLELLHTTVSYNLGEFTNACEHLPSDSVLRTLYDMVYMRHTLTADSPNASDVLSEQRNTLRSRLVRMKEAKTMSSFEPLFSWLHGLIRRESKDVPYKFFGYFEMLITEIHTCTGSPDTGGKHLETRRNPRRQSCIELPDTNSCDADVAVWFKSFMSPKGRNVQNLPCWREVEATNLCPGNRVDTRGLVLGIPIMLILGVPEPKEGAVWKFPETLLPMTKKLANQLGLIYDLVGFGLHSPTAAHFIARYALNSRSLVFGYDGMKNGGFAVQVDGASFLSHIAGENQCFPGGYTPVVAIYHLRGGSVAQNTFFEARRKVYAKNFQLHVSKLIPEESALPLCSYSGNLIELKPEARDWIKDTVNRNRTIEYVSSVMTPKVLSKLPSRVSSPNSMASEEATPNSNHSASDGAKPGSPNSVESEDPTANSNHVNDSDSSSLPDSLWMINCRCGLKSDGNVLYREDEGETVQCSECDDWSHIACQRDGRASLLGAKDKFICDWCNELTLWNPKYHIKQRESARKILASRVRLKKPLHERLLPGRGALGRIGDFWYPIRLVQYKEEEKGWLVRWWRGIKASGSIVPGSITQLEESNIVDSLWGDRNYRRKIRLGKWVHAHDIPTPEDILSDPSSVKYPPDMHESLAPFIQLLKEVLANPEDLEEIPAKDWLKSQRKNVRTGIVPFTGNLSVIERAQLGNWFETHVAGDKSMRRFWLGLVPFAHACTLWLATLLRKKKGGLRLKFDADDDKQVLQAAWELQTTDSPGKFRKDWTDVDKECLARLEEEMFERSSFAGIAGNYQWGLDAGDHEENWNPYEGTPEEWNHNDRETDEDEYKRAPDYIEVHRPPLAVKPQPRPRPLARRGKK